MTADRCPLCDEPGGRPLWRDALCRVVAVDDPALPGFLRVIVNRHVSEMTDLGAAEQARLLRVVMTLESLVRRHLAPDKVNLASLGNLVPHVHWHIIPRWRDDAWFPQPIWAPATRAVEVPGPRRAAAEAMWVDIEAQLASALPRDG